MTWEYHLELTSDYCLTEAKLNKLGKARWELAAAYVKDGAVVCWFKRRRKK